MARYGPLPVVRIACFLGAAMPCPGRLGEVANGRFREIRFTKVEFSGAAALEEVHRPFWVR